MHCTAIDCDFYLVLRRTGSKILDYKFYDSWQRKATGYRHSDNKNLPLAADNS